MSAAEDIRDRAAAVMAQRLADMEDGNGAQPSYRHLEIATSLCRELDEPGIDFAVPTVDFGELAKHVDLAAADAVLAGNFDEARDAVSLSIRINDRQRQLEAGDFQ